MGSADYLQAIKPDMGKLRKLIENSLLADWIIRVEYSGTRASDDGWQQWDKAMFALKSADEVLAALKACYTHKPGCVIRINAEKVRPRTQMYYTAYRPFQSPAVQESEARVTGMPITSELAGAYA